MIVFVTGRRRKAEAAVRLFCFLYLKQSSLRKCLKGMRQKAIQVLESRGMKDFWKKGHINRWLAANCFGDYYTREGHPLCH